MKERLLNAVRWLRKQWCKIPRQVRAIGNLIVCVVLIALVGIPMLWTFLAQFIPEVAFRYDEHLELIGPSKILGIVECASNDYDKTIVAQDDNTLVFYNYNSKKYNYKENLLSYIRKTDDIMLIPLPAGCNFSSYSRGLTAAQVLLVDEYPQAVRAEMDLQMHYDSSFLYDGTSHKINKTMMEFRLTADRHETGCFVFDLYVGEDDGTAETYWKRLNLSNFVLETTGYYRNRETFESTVRLFDASGAVIAEEKITIKQVIDVTDGNKYKYR